MKTNNYHLRHHEPLRLTPAQSQDPNLVLNDFFQSFRLNEIRETLWQWVTQVVSRPNSHANDHKERNNYLFFYEKLEALIEAAWVIMRGNSQQSKPAGKALVKSIRIANTSQSQTIQAARFSKRPRLIEKATSAPIEVITEVFDQLTLCDLTEDLLPNWLQVALINTQSPYSNGNDSKMLHEFYDLLIKFVSKLHIMAKNRQFTNPSSLFTDFFHQCSIDYIRRELADFLEAGIGHNGAYPNGFTPLQAWMVYNHLLCLIEAAYQLYINQHMQAVTIRLYSPKRHDFV